MKKYVLLSSFLSLFTSTALATITYREYDAPLMKEGRRAGSVRMQLSPNKDEWFNTSAYTLQNQTFAELIPEKETDQEETQADKQYIKEELGEALAKFYNFLTVGNLQAAARYTSRNNYEDPFNNPIFLHCAYPLSHQDLSPIDSIRLLVLKWDNQINAGLDFDLRTIEAFLKLVRPLAHKTFDNTTIATRQLRVYLSTLLQEGVSVVYNDIWKRNNKLPDNFYHKGVSPFSDDKEKNLELKILF